MPTKPLSDEGLLPCPGEPIVEVCSNGRMVGVDASIAPIASALNRAGIETIASCSGHGFRPGAIALRDGRELIIARDYDEARKIDRLFPLDINGDARPSPEPVEYEGVAEAARRFIAKLDECSPAIGDAFFWREMKCGPYAGPTYEKELADLRAVLNAKP